MSAVLYNDTYCIGIEELNKIYLALLTSADCVYINANTEVDWQLENEIYEHIKNNLETLYKGGYIVYWRFPFERPKYANEIVLEKNEYAMWDEMINKTYFNTDKMRSIFKFLSNGVDALTVREENTSKILLIRREYWSYALLKLLKADKVMNYFAGWMPHYEHLATINTASIEDMAIKKVFSAVSSSVFALNANDVIVINKKNKKLRTNLNSLNLKKDMPKDEIISILLSEAIDANIEVVKHEKSIFKGAATDIPVTLASFIASFTPIGIVTGIASSGKAVYDATRKLIPPKGKNEDDDISYLLIKMEHNLNRTLKKATKKGRTLDTTKKR